MKKLIDWLKYTSIKMRIIALAKKSIIKCQDLEELQMLEKTLQGIYNTLNEE